MLAQRLIYEVPGRFAAVACASGYLEANSRYSADARAHYQPTPVMTSHARDDGTVPFQRAGSRRANFDSRFSSEQENVNFWRAANGCRTTRTLWANATGELFSYEDCTDGAEVREIVLEHAGHVPYRNYPRLAEEFASFYSRFPFSRR
mmetsp:Transcript_12689/g.32137  ORF Transcript_12689/g.32137 Transcript_12689/m.32137 type:complete len:148 (+) Transcript_12689:680-1123(+)